MVVEGGRRVGQATAKVDFSVGEGRSSRSLSTEPLDLEVESLWQKQRISGLFPLVSERGCWGAGSRMRVC